MPKKTSEPQPVQDIPEEKIDERNAWGEDQEKHRYYYDDAHGYEKYDPDAKDEDDKQEKGG